MDKVREYGKAVAAFVAAVASNMVLDLSSGGAPWPQTQAEWLRYAVTSLATALVVAVSPANKLSTKQVTTAAAELGTTAGGALADLAVAAAASKAERVIADAVEKLPVQAQQVVAPITTQTSDAVQDVLRQLRGRL